MDAFGEIVAECYRVPTLAGDIPHFNVQLGYFFADLLRLMDRGVVFELVRTVTVLVPCYIPTNLYSSCRFIITLRSWVTKALNYLLSSANYLKYYLSILSTFIGIYPNPLMLIMSEILLTTTCTQTLFMCS